MFAETFECDAGVSGLVIKEEDWSITMSGEGSVPLDARIMEEAWAFRFAGKHESELIRKLYDDEDSSNLQEGSAEFEKLLAEAKAKDAVHREKAEAAFDAELKRAGLQPEPKVESIVYFFSGRAKMRVIECLQGDLKPGDEIEVTWKHIQRTISCPPVIPFKGECGWVFDSKLKNGAKVKLGHGFYSLEQGRTAKQKYLLGDTDAQGESTIKKVAAGFFILGMVAIGLSVYLWKFTNGVGGLGGVCSALDLFVAGLMISIVSGGVWLFL